MKKIFIINVYQEYGEINKEEIKKLLEDYNRGVDIYETNEVGVYIRKEDRMER